MTEKKIRDANASAGVPFGIDGTTPPRYCCDIGFGESEFHDALLALLTKEAWSPRELYTLLVQSHSTNDRELTDMLVRHWNAFPQPAEMYEALRVLEEMLAWLVAKQAA